jgi:hypothetical protein
MRQWELFGITDSQPVWAPPKVVEPETDAVVTVLGLGGEEKGGLSDRAAGRPAPSHPSNDATASSTAPTSSGPCCVPRVHSS